MYVRYKEMPDDLDYVIVVGGTMMVLNWIQLAVLMYLKERLAMLCEGLIEKYPTAKIFFFTRWNCKNFAGSDAEKVWML